MTYIGDIYRANPVENLPVIFIITILTFHHSCIILWQANKLSASQILSTVYTFPHQPNNFCRLYGHFADLFCSVLALLAQLAELIV